MTTGSRPPKRPGVGSRNPTGRPRKVAGRRDASAADTSTPAVEAPPQSPEPPAPAPDEPVADEPVADEQSSESAPPSDPAPPDEGTGQRARLLGSGRTTVALLLALALLAGVLAVESWYVWFRPEPAVSAERPVVTGEIAHRAAVEAASQSVTEILSYDYENFDAQIEDATSKLTASFEKEYRDTAAGVREEFIRAKTQQEVKVQWASVVQASSEQVKALLFLDQYVIKNGKGTSVTPFRALVTMVHTDDGWLIDNIDTN